LKAHTAQWTIHCVSTLPNGVSVEGICMQSVFPQCLGRLEEWVDRIRVSHQAGFNAIHFTPLEVSPYFISFF
jgi:hypothetical protein